MKNKCKDKTNHAWQGIGPVIKAGTQMVKCIKCGKVGYKLHGVQVR